MLEVVWTTEVLPKDDLKLSIVDSKPLALANGVSEKDGFFVHTPRKTIAEVLESKQVEKCIVMATITGIDSDMGWYYLSCKVCAKKVITVPNDNCDDGDEHGVLACNYYCLKCKNNSPKLLPRYKLHLVDLDNTNDCKFLLFDNLALQLLHQPYIEVTGPITDEIGIEKENFVYKHDTFKVLKIITNLGMINESEAAQSPTGSENMLSGTFSTQSDAPEGSLMIQGCSSGSTDLTPAKRTRTPIINLEEAFDQNSVTKMACTIKVKKEKFEKVARFLLFVNLALQLLHQPCIELTGPITDEILDPDVLPPILNDLKGKTFLFKIGIEKENFVYKHDTFKVLKIITNLGMINEFEAAQSPTGSLMIQSDSSGSTDLTPAKRTRTPIINLEEAFDQNSVTKMACNIKVKKEKFEKVARNQQEKKNENGDGIPPPKRRKQVNRTNEEPDLNVLQDITNSSGNITKDARMQRRLRLLQKPKFGDRNIQEVNQTGISMIQSQNVHKLPSQGSQIETQNQNISVMENHPIEMQSNQTAGPHSSGSTNLTNIPGPSSSAISVDSDSSDNDDDLWDCSSGEGVETRTDSDTCEDNSSEILKRQAQTKFDLVSKAEKALAEMFGRLQNKKTPVADSVPIVSTQEKGDRDFTYMSTRLQKKKTTVTVCAPIVSTKEKGDKGTCNVVVDPTMF
ncbi:hypothetical protein F2Q69_00036125 [Brassica cretica]|uniref:Replication factor A C-terminal domain-containing protein n=1 Tax=Brassica cretica TaxID=69181 RepID=A0A8S9SDP9_BRACR|nr:hypothetical protein F2Q69_00036125 [Brassica cretica]